jgi:ATP-dependent DNA helicase RecQ
VQQIHIVGEYAKKMLSNYHEALAFVDDYFTLDYETFLLRYFPGRQGELKRPLLPEQFRELFSSLSVEQMQIIQDNASDKIVVTAGPGSGKTRVLVHKVASLLLLEDTKPEQFLMLTFSRAAALEFRARLRGLVKGLAGYVDVHTYHGYCFHLLGRVGTLEKSDGIIGACLEAIRNGTVPPEKIAAKTVLVVDEFQDVNEVEYALLQEIIRVAGDIRVIVVGDEDQNIYEFRGRFGGLPARLCRTVRGQTVRTAHQLPSRPNLVAFANRFLLGIGERGPKGRNRRPTPRKRGHSARKHTAEAPGDAAGRGRATPGVARHHGRAYAHQRRGATGRKRPAGTRRPRAAHPFERRLFPGRPARTPALHRWASKGLAGDLGA